MRVLGYRGDHSFPFLVSATMESVSGLIPTSSKPCQSSISVDLETLKNEVSEMLGDDGVLLCPTHPTVAPFHRQSYFKPINPMYAAIFNVMGFPATTIPVGLSSEESMPLSIQVFSHYFIFIIMSGWYHSIKLQFVLKKASDPRHGN